MASSRSLIASATAYSVRSGASPVSVITSIGSKRENLISSTRGSSASVGSLALAMSTRSRTSSSAWSMSTSGWNSRLMEIRPSCAEETISFTPAMERISCSMGRTSRRSASSGETPSSVTVMLMNGKLTSGSASLGML